MLFFMLLFVLISCDNNTIGMDSGEDSYGGLSLNLMLDYDVETTSLKSEDDNENAANEDDIADSDSDLDGFIIQVLKDGATYTWYYYDDMPDIVNLKSGEYTIKASKGTNPAIAFSSPYYEGTEDIEIIQTQQTDVDISCALANAMLSLSFSEDFDKVYPDYQLILTTKYWTSDEYFTVSKGDSRDVYFYPADMGMALILKRYDNEIFSYSLPNIEDVEARNRYNISFDVDYEDDAAIEVTIDETTNDITDSYVVSDSWLTKSVPMITGTKPTGEEITSLYQAATIGSFQTVVVSDGELKSLTIASESSDFTDAMGASSINLVGISDSDNTALANFGIKYSGTLGSTTNCTIRLTDMLNNLSVGKHTFTVTATDIYDQSATYSVTFNVVDSYSFSVPKPEDGDIWATRATLSSVSYDDLTGLIINTYPDLKHELISSSDGTSTTLNFKGAESMEIPGLTAGTTYSYRVTLADRYSSETTFTTEAAQQHNEPSFESWSTANVYKGTFYCYLVEWYANSSSSSSAGYWGTNNPTTTSQRSGWSTYYTGYSGTQSTTSKVSGTYAARIATVGWGNANTYSFGNLTTSVVYNTTCGEIRSALNGSDGIPFTSRPASLKFYYKYAPVNSNSMEAYIILENRDNSTVEIGRGEFISGTSISSYTSKTIDVTYDSQYTHLKATHIRLIFRSAASSDLSKDDLTAVDGSKGAISGYYDSYFEGSVLCIDDVELIY